MREQSMRAALSLFLAMRSTFYRRNRYKTDLYAPVLIPSPHRLSASHGTSSARREDNESEAIPEPIRDAIPCNHTDGSPLPLRGLTLHTLLPTYKSRQTFAGSQSVRRPPSSTVRANTKFRISAAHKPPQDALKVVIAPKAPRR